MAWSELFVCLLSHISPSVYSSCHVLSGRRKFVGICLKRLRSRVMPQTNIPTYPQSAFSQRSPTIVNNIRPCPKRCLLMPLTRVVVRTESTTLQLHAREVWPISAHAHWHNTKQYAVYTEGFALHWFFLRVLKLAIFLNSQKFAKFSTRL